MKKIVLFVLTVFTMGTAVIGGCGNEKTISYDNKLDSETLQIRTVEESEPTEPECPDDKNNDGECPNKKKRDGKCPKSRRPHKRRNEKLPRPESAYRKH